MYPSFQCKIVIIIEIELSWCQRLKTELHELYHNPRENFSSCLKQEKEQAQKYSTQHDTQLSREFQTAINCTQIDPLKLLYHQRIINKHFLVFSTVFMKLFVHTYFNSMCAQSRWEIHKAVEKVIVSYIHRLF